MSERTASLWYKQAKPGHLCGDKTRCPNAKKDGTCNSCNTVDGRFMNVVNEYASTCDGECGEQHSHDHLTMDPVTQLGYCDKCIPLLPKEVRDRLEREEKDEDTQRSD